MNKTKIEWCDFTWNPVWGCKNNCEFCYARKINDRFKIIKNWNNPEWIENNFNKTFPKKPSRIFINSMSDITFWRPEWMKKVLNKIKEYPKHQFFFLTKDAYFYSNLKCSKNSIWLGVTANTRDQYVYSSCNMRENVNQKYRKFISIEPIFEPMRFFTLVFDWVIIGAETGNHKNKVIPKKEWIEEIRIFCEQNNIPYFEKNSLQKIVDRPLIQQFPQ